MFKWLAISLLPKSVHCCEKIIKPLINLIHKPFDSRHTVMFTLKLVLSLALSQTLNSSLEKLISASLAQVNLSFRETCYL